MHPVLLRNLMVEMVEPAENLTAEPVENLELAMESVVLELALV